MSLKDTVTSLPPSTQIAGGILGACGLGGLVAAIAFDSWKAYVVAILTMAVLGVIAFFALKAWEKAKKKRDAARFESDLDDGLGDDGGKDKAEQEEMRKKLMEGVQQYEKSGSNVYESPWLVLVGPPSAGKSVLLQKCGLVDQADALKGVGGTRGMNWWFVDADVGGDTPIHAVVLDMAGAVFMDQRQEGRWDKFLDFLRQHRRYEPLNGVLLVVSVQDLLGKTPEQLTDEAGKVRAQLERIRTKLDVRFPVWIVVTKCDLVDGFKEFFDTIQDASVAAQMLGWSKPGSLDEPFNPKQVREHISGIVAQMRKFRLKSLADMVIGPEIGVRQTDRADTMFSLPVTFDDLGANLEKYLDVVFARKKVSTAPPFVRGVYFTSSERKGASISKMLKDLGIAPVDEQWPDRAFFNKDVFGQKIFQETMLVTPAQNVDKMRRKRRLMAYGTGIGASLILAGLTAWSWFALSRGVNDVTTFYAALAQPNVWEKVKSSSGTGASLAEFGLRAPRASADVQNVPQLVQASQLWASETPPTPWIFRPLSLFTGRADMPEVRREVHTRLMREVVVKPVIERANAVLNAEQTWTINGPADIDRFKRAAAALSEIVRFNRKTILKGEKSLAPSTLTKSAPEPVLDLKPLLELLAGSDDKADSFAKAWLQDKGDQTIKVALTGYQREALSTTTDADAAAMESLFAPLAEASIADNLASFASAEQARNTAVLLKVFRDSLDKQLKGEAGLLKKLDDLRAALGKVEAERIGLDQLVKSSVNSTREYDTFVQGWQTKANSFSDNATLASKLFEEVKLGAGELKAKLDLMTELFPKQFDLVAAQVGTADNIKPPALDAITRWKDAISPGGALPNFKQFDARRADIEPKLLPTLGLVAISADNKPALNHATAMLAEVSKTLDGDVMKKMTEPGPTGVSLIWDAKSIDDRTNPALNPALSLCTTTSTNSSSWGLPTTGGGTGNFVSQVADHCKAALAIVRRRAVGTHVDAYIKSLSTQSSGLANALQAATGSSSKPVGILPMTPSFASGSGQIGGQLSPKTINAFFDGWESLRPGLEGAPGTVPDAPIIDREKWDLARKPLTDEIERYRTEARTFWETKIAADCSVSDGPADETWAQFLGEVRKLSATSIHQTLVEISADRDLATKRLTTPGAAPAPRAADWNKLSKAQEQESLKQVQGWLQFWSSLPDDPLDAGAKFRDQLNADTNLIGLDRMPYWESLSLRGLRALNTSTGQSFKDQCNRITSYSGFPIVREIKGSVVAVADMPQASDLFCKMEPRKSVANPGVRPSDSKVLSELSTILARGNDNCPAPTNACAVAKALSRPISVRVEPDDTGGAGANNILFAYPKLETSARGPGAQNFKLAVEGFETSAVLPNVTWKFLDDTSANKKWITLTFQGEWYIVGLIAKFGRNQGGNVWIVSIPTIRSARDLIDFPPEAAELGLSFKVIIKGDASLPSESDWPRR